MNSLENQGTGCDCLTKICFMVSYINGIKWKLYFTWTEKKHWSDGCISCYGKNFFFWSFKTEKQKQNLMKNNEKEQ